ncbi:MAG: tRNA (adenosine(37)-N6)-threonylcarbamoyltransferase complex ATPase subunit type 1 TsaE, partial [Clostridiales bacterium]|nr:tRNA (adenosine(37)-N6)-threonylcarbamoyltransferase complex ATPase subunit type 1 TsaE [Clostridiales bacterium]
IASPDEMQRLGELIARETSGGDVVLLSGELGAGKTVFSKGFAKGLGIDSEVSSPTFTIMNEHIGTVKFCHIDAYRLSSAD